jgi:exopolysaccharide biosynthesis polyprenyl glycosylphosphotransferase
MSCDFFAGLLSAGLALTVRFQAQPGHSYLWFSVLVAVIWVGIVAAKHGYEPRIFGRGLEEYQRLWHAGPVLFVAIAVISYVGRESISRAYVLMVVPGTLLLSLAIRHLLRNWLSRLRSQGHGLQRVLVVGHAQDSESLIQQMGRHQQQNGLIPVGVCLVGTQTPSTTSIQGVKVLGDQEDILRRAQETGAKVVAVVSNPDLCGHTLRRLSWALEDLGIDLIISPGIVEVATPRLSIQPLAGLSLLHVQGNIPARTRVLYKAVFDRSTALAMLLLLAPLLAAIAVSVKLTSPGPVLFRQQRIGVNGRPFTMLKFRSMVVNAEHLRENLVPKSEGNEVLFKMRRDPRVTRIGSVLRRFSLDEIPQLINVIRGDMALVGPRPPLPEEVARYSPDAIRRLRVRPGLTGLWQVSGRSDLSWEESLLLDLRYVDNWSISMDLSILCRTWRAVVTGSGAY